MRNRIWLLLAAVVVLGAVAYYAIFVWSFTNLRITVDIDTPKGIRSGSSVIQTRVLQSGCWGPVEACGVRGEVHGEAVHVDLGNGRRVFAVLGWGPKGQDQRIFGLVEATPAVFARPEQQRPDGVKELPASYVPAFVTFENLLDPKTARVVQPAEFEQVFGAGIHLARIRIEVTNDWPSKTIVTILPWLPTTNYLNGRNACDPNAPHCLDRGHFKR
jgi:hypothetical protein